MFNKNSAKVNVCDVCYFNIVIWTHLRSDWYKIPKFFINFLLNTCCCKRCVYKMTRTWLFFLCCSGKFLDFSINMHTQTSHLSGSLHLVDAFQIQPDLLWHPIYPISQAADGSTVLNIRHLSRECGNNRYSHLPFSFTALFFWICLFVFIRDEMNNLQPFSIKVFTSFSALQILIKFLMTLNIKSKCLK